MSNILYHSFIMKKKIPLAILEALQPVANKNLDLTKIVKDNNAMFHLIDRDENSDFYFKVIKQEARNGKLHYLIDLKPRSKDNINSHSYWSMLDSIVVAIENWLEILLAYNKIHTIYDDPILKSNQERFEKQFDIVDEDANITTFDLPQQLFLDDYLNTVKSKLNDLQNGRTETQVKELEYLILEASEIQNNLTKETKREIV